MSVWMEDNVILLLKVPLEELAERGAWHSSMPSPKYPTDTGSLGLELRKKIFESIESDPGILNPENVKASVDEIVKDSIGNAIEHGNHGDCLKKVEAYFLLEGHPSGNALMYLVVRDGGRGFDFSNVKAKPEHVMRNTPFSWFGGPNGKNVDFAYNFGDSAIYMVKVVRREGAKEPNIEKRGAILTTRKLSPEQYHGGVYSIPDDCYSKHGPRTRIDVFDLHALQDEWIVRNGMLAPKPGYAPAEPYVRVTVLKKELGHKLREMRLGGVKIPYKECSMQRYAVVHPNSLFKIGEDVTLSLGLSKAFQDNAAKIINYFRQFEPQIISPTI